MQYEEFLVHSTVRKCVYLPLNHELEVSTESSALTYSVGMVFKKNNDSSGGEKLNCYSLSKYTVASNKLSK